jgi:stage II sporulation protein D
LGFFVFYATSKMKVINVLDMETYTKCVMSNEIGTNATVETRRAFSVLVRTVALHAYKHDKYGADVCYTTCCQVYLGTYRRSSENDAIVDSTKGQYVAYEGEPISCLYHNSNGGASCSSVAAWGGSEIPYLTSVTLKEDAGNISEMWQYTFTQKELYDFLSSRGAFSGLEGGIHDVRIDGTDPYGSGYVTLLSVTDRYGNEVSVKTSEKVRTALKFQSANFTVSYSAQAEVVGADGTVSTRKIGGYVDANGKYVEFDSFEKYTLAGTDETFGADTIRFDGVGVGHGVGFSSNGSEQLAEQGYSYRYIIQFYFSGTEILNLYS